MKLKQREKWHGVTILAGQRERNANPGKFRPLGRVIWTMDELLCGYCKHKGIDSESCDYVLYHYPVCEHPLNTVREQGILSDAYGALTDCWGFRPAKRWMDVAAEFEVNEASAVAIYQQELKGLEDECRTRQAGR